MKKITFFLFFLMIMFSALTQIAPNFNSNDCSGTNYDLYTQLNAGKIIVVCWVMPCSTCIPATKTSYNVVQSFQTTNPNKVFLYLCDDYGDTPCASVDSWANGISVPASASSLRFSNSAIVMSNYGSAGMPKIVIIGGSSHTILYSANGTVNGSTMQTAISTALATSSVEETGSISSDINLFPNPVNSTMHLSISMEKQSVVNIEIYNNIGQQVYVNSDSFIKGVNNIDINANELNNGIYFVKISDATSTKTLKFNVSH